MTIPIGHLIDFTQLKSLQKIDNSAFKNTCLDQSLVNLANSKVTSIGRDAFEYEPESEAMAESTFTTILFPKTMTTTPSTNAFGITGENAKVVPTNSNNGSLLTAAVAPNRSISQTPTFLGEDGDFVVQGGSIVGITDQGALKFALANDEVGLTIKPDSSYEAVTSISTTAFLYGTNVSNQLAIYLRTHVNGIDLTALINLATIGQNAFRNVADGVNSASLSDLETISENCVSVQKFDNIVLSNLTKLAEIGNGAFYNVARNAKSCRSISLKNSGAASGLSIGQNAFRNVGTLSHKYYISSSLEINLSGSTVATLGWACFQNVFGEASEIAGVIDLSNCPLLQTLGDSTTLAFSGTMPCCSQIKLSDCIKLKTISKQAFVGVGSISYHPMGIDLGGCAALEAIEEGAFKAFCYNPVFSETQGLPDKMVDFATLTSLKTIGNEAFMNVGFYQATLDLTATKLTSIGQSAFQFTTTNGTQLTKEPFATFPEILFPSTLVTPPSTNAFSIVDAFGVQPFVTTSNNTSLLTDTNSVGRQIEHIGEEPVQIGEEGDFIVFNFKITGYSQKGKDKIASKSPNGYIFRPTEFYNNITSIGGLGLSNPANTSLAQSLRLYVIGIDLSYMESLVEIETNAFYGFADGVDSANVTVQNPVVEECPSVTKFGVITFRNCTSLLEIGAGAFRNVAVNSQTFQGFNFSECGTLARVGANAFANVGKVSTVCSSIDLRGATNLVNIEQGAFQNVAVFQDNFFIYFPSQTVGTISLGDWSFGVV